LSKQSSVISPTAKVVGFEASLQTVGDMLLGTARFKVSNSPEAIAAIRKQAAAEGYLEGQQKGRSAGYELGLKEGREFGRAESFRQLEADRQAEIDAFAAALDRSTKSFQSSLSEWYGASEQRMTELAMNAVKAVLGAELAISRESALEIVKQAIGEVTNAQKVRVRVNPFDSILVQQFRADIIASSSALRDVEIVDDPSILGGCIIETDGGLIDASVDTRLESLEQTLEEAA
jgi:flagellar biosynthesis/type III secretory pathway protein FliH